jgi:hypothetical protein
VREYSTIAEGYIIQDNNFLACSREHRLKVYEMLSRQTRAAVFSGGIDCRLVTDEVAAELASIRIAQMFLAADTADSLDTLARAVDRLRHRHNYSRRKLRCYVLIGYDGETIEQAESRLEGAWSIGVLPFAQLFRPPVGTIEYGHDWLALWRKWTRPAAMFSAHEVM